MNHRDITFDVMKGIGILAMIIGHSNIPIYLEKFIFVWHIPMFFVVSGYFYKKESEKVYLKKNVRHLILPYIATSLIMIALSLVKQMVIGKGDTMTMVISTLVGNGTVNNPTFSRYSVGAIWFLLALFWCRLFFNFLQTRISSRVIMSIALVTLATISTYVGTSIYIPTDILQGISALLFFYLGYLVRIYKILDYNINTSYLIVVVILALLSVNAGSMSMVRCYYGYWPINFLAAIGVTHFVYHISRHLTNYRFLSWCGRVSMVILCVHIIELTFFPINYLHQFFNLSNYFDVFIHLSISIIISYIIILTSPIRKLFSIQ